MAGAPEKDPISGLYTTGHEWDGIAELNTPLPRWWMYVFYTTVIWAVGYWIVYPSFPVGKDFLPGIWEYSSRREVEADLIAAHAAHQKERSAIAAGSVDEIYANPPLRAYAIAGGGVLFKDNCAGCHQSGGAGAVGYPTLADDEWIWGGTLADIQQTLLHGIRYDRDPETRQSQMLAFGDILSTDEIKQVAAYVKDMSNGKVVAGPGQTIYTENCAACHSSDGANPVSDGNPAMGAPPLGNRVWLYAGPGKEMTMERLQAQIAKPKHGVMPAWSGRLKDEDIKMLTVYVHSLGGGQ
ncbi:cytochrome-c oxidase, cbb3-type subunit III [Haematospirillum sp. H1815]|uniref:cytochrome-c oxidase, cbb3-type subunit III n=1 Tax=Haematospirillum sp. H1815 TaxID=2723108 RepID=UPI0014394C92|nr:cytochrome-c oxidase, cbb3-type subunit III [Haematospirillum sp. H1815]NKD77467.1 cytochrome-c oxidase, cbb3-type subunit III [Haematospirillum sp. H1815]